MYRVRVRKCISEKVANATASGIATIAPTDLRMCVVARSECGADDCSIYTELQVVSTSFRCEQPSARNT